MVIREGLEPSTQWLSFHFYIVYRGHLRQIGVKAYQTNFEQVRSTFEDFGFDVNI